MPDSGPREAPVDATFTPKAAKALDRAWAESDRLADELESLETHLRAVIENCEHMDVGAIRHQLVGLLPEVRPPSAELCEKLPDLAARRDEAVREAWAGYGYSGTPDADPGDPKDTKYDPAT